VTGVLIRAGPHPYLDNVQLLTNLVHIVRGNLVAVLILVLLWIALTDALGSSKGVVDRSLGTVHTGVLEVRDQGLHVLEALHLELFALLNFVFEGLQLLLGGSVDHLRAVELHLSSKVLFLVLDQLPQLHLIGLADHPFLDRGHIWSNFLEALGLSWVLLVCLVVENVPIFLDVVIQCGRKPRSLQVLRIVHVLAHSLRIPLIPQALSQYLLFWTIRLMRVALSIDVSIVLVVFSGADGSGLRDNVCAQMVVSHALIGLPLLVLIVKDALTTLALNKLTYLSHSHWSLKSLTP